MDTRHLSWRLKTKKLCSHLLPPQAQERFGASLEPDYNHLLLTLSGTSVWSPAPTGRDLSHKDNPPAERLGQGRQALRAGQRAADGGSGFGRKFR